MPEGIYRILVERHGFSEDIANQMIVEYQCDMEVIIAEKETQETGQENDLIRFVNSRRDRITQAHIVTSDTTNQN